MFKRLFIAAVIGTAAVYGALYVGVQSAKADEAAPRFYFRSKPGVLTLPASAHGSEPSSPLGEGEGDETTPDGDETTPSGGDDDETQEPDTPPYAPAEGLKFEAAHIMAPAQLGLSFEEPWLAAVVYPFVNEGDEPVTSPEVRVSFSPWGPASETFCDGDYDPIGPGESGECIAFFELAGNSQILALGREPGEQAEIAISAELAALNGVPLNPGRYPISTDIMQVEIGPHFLPHYRVTLIGLDGMPVEVAFAVPFLASSDQPPIFLPSYATPVADEQLPSRNVVESVAWGFETVYIMTQDDTMRHLDLFIAPREAGGYELAFFEPYGDNFFPYPAPPVAVYQIP